MIRRLIAVLLSRKCSWSLGGALARTNKLAFIMVGRTSKKGRGDDTKNTEMKRRERETNEQHTDSGFFYG